MTYAGQTGGYYIPDYKGPKPKTSVKKKTDYYNSSDSIDSVRGKYAPATTGQIDAKWDGVLGGLDPLTGPTANDLMQMINNAPTVPGDPGGGGGSGRSYGSSGGGVSSAQQTAAYQQYLASLAAQKNPYADTSRFTSLYDPAVINERFDRFGSQVGEAGRTGRDRVAGIVSDLAARTGQAGTQIGAGFDARAEALAQLQREFAQAQGAEQAGLNKILASADAGSVQAENAPLNNLFTASQTSLGDAQNLFAQSMADRQAISGQLGQDVGLGMSQQEQALMAQVAAQRAAQLQGNDNAKTKLLADLYLKQQEWENQRQQQEAQLRLQAAQMGISI